VCFSYRDATASLTTLAPLVELDTSGRVRVVRFNPRSMQPPRLDPVGGVDTATLDTWYAGYVGLAQRLADPRYQIRLRLQPGELFVVDNRRVLHGRAAFQPTTGSRHLQGCYADIDGLRSTVAVLARDLGEVPAWAG
jgi:gamma-butyrobetaine dioxygenase